MDNLTERMDPLDSTAAFEIKERFEAIGIHLQGDALVKKTEAYLMGIRKNMLKGVQYFAAKELAWEQVS